MITLRDGSQIVDPRLDRLVQFDERSRNYSIGDMIGRRPFRSIKWSIAGRDVLDQGYEGACVGFAVTNRLRTYPFRKKFASLDHGNRFSNYLYHNAQRIDPWPGGSYPGAKPFYEGTSVLAGLQVAKREGWIGEYRWAFTMEDFIKGIAFEGPAILGLEWYDSTYDTDRWHYIRPEGRSVGGHALIARGIRCVFKDRQGPKTFSNLDLRRSRVTLRNSWGQYWGKRGDAYVTLDDMWTWLLKDGEAAFVRR